MELKYRVRVVVTGPSRPLDVRVAQLLDSWRTAWGHPASMLALFRTEIRVTEDRKEFWLSIQEPLPCFRGTGGYTLNARP
jgi:hypothetical protein